MLTHQLTEIYPNPEQFDPYRFSPQRQEHKQRPFSLIGFGGGSRICIGIAFAKMEMKIVAAHLLRGYEWELLPNQSLDSVLVPTRRPKDRLRVRLQPLPAIKGVGLRVRLEKLKVLPCMATDVRSEFTDLGLR